MLDQEDRVKDLVVDEYQLRASAHYKQVAYDRCPSVGDVGKVLFGIGIHRAATCRWKLATRNLVLKQQQLEYAARMFSIAANGLADLLSGPLPATSLDLSQRLIFDLVAFERQQIRRVNNAEHTVRVVLFAPIQIPSSAFLAKTPLEALED